VFDITKRKSFENITLWLKESREQTEPHKGAYLIVGHKSDRDDERQVTTREGKMFAESNGLRYIETSAKRPPKEPFHVVEGEPESSGCC